MCTGRRTAAGRGPSRYGCSRPLASLHSPTPATGGVQPGRWLPELPTAAATGTLAAGLPTVSLSPGSSPSASAAPGGSEPRQKLTCPPPSCSEPTTAPTTGPSSTSTSRFPFDSLSYLDFLDRLLEAGASSRAERSHQGPPVGGLVNATVEAGAQPASGDQ